MKFVILIAFCCVSCGSNPVSQPFATQALQAETIAKPVKVEVEKEEVTKEVKKTLAGKVTFADLSEKELADFRVIPETGVKLFTPKNASYEQVDGFWWKGNEEGKWFKIPDSSEAWVGKGEAPERFEGRAEAEGLALHYRSSDLVKVFGFLISGVGRPGWVVNGGKTQSPVPSPWLERD